MTHVELWRSTCEALWQKAQGIITPEEMRRQIERVVNEYQGGAVQMEMRLK